MYNNLTKENEFICLIKWSYVYNSYQLGVLILTEKNVSI